MHCLSTFFNMEVKFGPSEKRIKSDWHQSRWSLSAEQPVHTIWPQKKWKHFGRVESTTSLRETKKIQIKLATTCNKNEQQDAKNYIEWKTTTWKNFEKNIRRGRNRSIETTRDGLWWWWRRILLLLVVVVVVVLLHTSSYRRLPVHIPESIALESNWTTD